MLFKITHIDAAGHCHRARVTARNLADALDQVAEQFGEARRLSCLRLQPKPELVVNTGPHFHHAYHPERRAPCAS